jgi:hypothetical protein
VGLKHRLDVIAAKVTPREGWQRSLEERNRRSDEARAMLNAIVAKGPQPPPTAEEKAARVRELEALKISDPKTWAEREQAIAALRKLVPREFWGDE